MSIGTHFLCYRIDKAVAGVYRLVLSDFTNLKLVTSCVAFIEMLSRDSTHLRVDSLSASRIYTYLLNRDSNGTNDEGENREKNLKKKIGKPTVHVQYILYVYKQPITSNTYYFYCTCTFHIVVMDIS